MVSFMKEHLKPIILLVLLAVFVVIAVIPEPTSAVMMPGKYIGEYEYGPTCECPHILYWNCGCHFIKGN